MMTSQCITDGKFSCSADRQNRVAHICAISTNPDKDLTVTGYLQDRNLLPNIYNIQFITKCLQGNDLLLNIYKIRIYLVLHMFNTLKTKKQTKTCHLFFADPLSAVQNQDRKSVVQSIQLDWMSNTSQQESICQRTRRAVINSRPRMKSSRREKSRSAGSIFVKIIFHLIFQNNFQNNAQTKIDPADSDLPRRILQFRGLRPI